jgi:hypothetical protein
LKCGALIRTLKLGTVEQVKEIDSEEELDDILKADDRPLVLLAGFTWCRPCKVGRSCCRFVALQARQSLVRWEALCTLRTGCIPLVVCMPQGLQMPFQKLADKYRDVKFVKVGPCLVARHCRQQRAACNPAPACVIALMVTSAMALVHASRHACRDIPSDTGRILLQFYGNANENTKRLFRDRLKARATPTLAMFDASGEMRHQHSGANKSRLEFYLREFIGETDSDTIYPPYQLTGRAVTPSGVFIKLAPIVMYYMMPSFQGALAKPGL